MSNGTEVGLTVKGDGPRVTEGGGTGRCRSDANQDPPGGQISSAGQPGRAHETG